MQVVNVSGITYGFSYNGRTIVVPFDNRVYTLPDDVDMSQFGNCLRIVTPPAPKPKQQEIVIIQNPIEEPAKVEIVSLNTEETNTNVVTIDLDLVETTKGIEVPVEVPVEKVAKKKTVKKASTKKSVAKAEKKSF